MHTRLVLYIVTAAIVPFGTPALASQPVRERPVATAASAPGAAARPVSFPGPVAEGTHEWWSLDPAVEFTVGPGWSTGWELGDDTITPNRVVALQHPLADGYVRLVVWTNYGLTLDGDPERKDDLRAFVRAHPDIESLAESELPLADGTTATRFDFTVAGPARTWLAKNEPGTEGLPFQVVVGDGLPQHWVIAGTEFTQQLITWTIEDAAAGAAVEAEALVTPLIESLRFLAAPEMPPVPGSVLAARAAPPGALVGIGEEGVVGRLTAGADMVFARRHVDGPDEPHTIVAFDPETGGVTATAVVGTQALGIVAGHGSLWVCDFAEDVVRRLDPQTFAELAVIRVGRDPSHVTVSDDAVWVANHRGGSVSRIDPLTDTVTDEFTVSGPGQGGPYGPTQVGDELWVPVPQFDELTRIDLTTGAVTTTAGLSLVNTAPVVIDQYVFVTGDGSPFLAVVDRNTGEHVADIATGGWTGTPIEIDGTVWVTVGDARPDALGGWLVGVDPDRLEIVDAVSLALAPTTVLDAFDSIWVADIGGAVTRYPRSTFTA